METWEMFQRMLHILREAEHLSQEEFGARLGIGRVHVNRLENGKRKPSKLLLRCIEREFNLNAEQLTQLNEVASLIETDKWSIE